MNPQPKLNEKAEEVIINLDDDDDDDDVDVDFDVDGGGFDHKSPSSNDKNKNTTPIFVDHYSVDQEDIDLNLAILASLETASTRTETRNPNSHRDTSYYFIDDDDDDDDDGDVIILPSAPKKPKTNLESKNPFMSQNSVTEKGESSKMKSNFGLDPDFDCGICYDRKPGCESYPIQGCTHVYCNGCVVEYIDSKLKENITNIRCPELGCVGLLEPDSCRGILPIALFDRWCVALSESGISESQRFYCPYKDCSVLMIDDGEEVVTESRCPDCKRMFCARCKVAWHEGMSCEEFQMLNKDEKGNEDVMLMSLAANKQWRRCPKCRFFVEKTYGCNYMRCRCGASFCYSCGTNTTTHGCLNCDRSMMHMMNLARMRPVGINLLPGQANNAQGQALVPQHPNIAELQARLSQQHNLQAQARFPPQLSDVTSRARLQRSTHTRVQASLPQRRNNTRVQAPFPQQPNNVQIPAQFIRPNNVQLQAHFPQQPDNIQEQARLPQDDIQAQLLQLHHDLQLQHNFQLRARFPQVADSIQVRTQFPSSTPEHSSSGSVP